MKKKNKYKNWKDLPCRIRFLAFFKKEQIAIEIQGKSLFFIKFKRLPFSETRLYFGSTKFEQGFTAYNDFYYHVENGEIDWISADAIHWEPYGKHELLSNKIIGYKPKLIIINTVTNQ